MKEDKNSLKKNTKKQNPRKDALANDAGWMELPLQPANGPGAGGAVSTFPFSIITENCNNSNNKQSTRCPPFRFHFPLPPLRPPPPIAGP